MCLEQDGDKNELISSKNTQNTNCYQTNQITKTTNKKKHCLGSNEIGKCSMYWVKYLNLCTIITENPNKY